MECGIKYGNIFIFNSGNALKASLIPIKWAGLCNGANCTASRIPSITLSLINTDWVNLSPPCTIRCPIATMLSFNPASCGKILLTIKSNASLCAAPAPNSALPFSPFSFHLIRASSKLNASAKPDNFSSPDWGSKMANFKEELPQFRTRINFCDIIFNLFHVSLENA